MSPPFQVAPLGASPTHPNSIAWSDDNLIAVATGQTVRILNPEKPHSPRGVINLTAKDPFPLGTVDRKDLLSPCLLPTCLARDRRPCVRSISWSPPGFVSNYGCLLGVCTTEGSVKIYCHPYFQFRAEWLEVLDVSDILYEYLAKTNYGEAVVPLLSDGSGLAHVFTGNSAADNRSTTRVSKRRKCITNYASLDYISLIPDDATGDHTKTPVSLIAEAEGDPISILQKCSSAQVHETSSSKEGDNLLQIVPATTSRKNRRNGQEDCISEHITADVYASRYALISSLVVVWSPVVSLRAVAPDNSSISYCLLAVGAKSGHISLWRVHRPDTYSVEHNDAPKMMLAGHQKIHNAWVTTLAWGLLAPDASNPKLLLVSGSSDGSVKIWLGDSEDMLRSEANPASFSLLTEVTTDDTSPISVVSLAMSGQSSHRMVLAIGKGSGSVEVWTFDIARKELKTAGCYAMHDHIVTGLAWAFDGCCLYSCSQDSSMRSWMLHKDSLTEVSLPPNNLSTKSFADLPCVYDSCFGVTVSPGNLVVAVVRSFDLDMLHPMYQARNQRAAVEFFWIGSQQRNMISEFYLELDVKATSAFTDEELVSWGTNILWSLRQYESHNKHLVVWDIMTALSAFKQCAPTFLEHILSRWIIFLEGHADLITRRSALYACRSLSKVSSRKLHLLNIFCRRVMLPYFNADELNTEQLCSIESSESEERLWMKLLQSSERELRERLVGFSFSSALCMMSNVETQQKAGASWKPSGISQMLRWVHLNSIGVRHQLTCLSSEVEKLTTRLQNAGLYESEELCPYCSSPVDFESAESACCRGLMSKEGQTQGCKLPRCAVSMQVCPVRPSWFCVCCQRRVFKLPPHQLFTLPNYLLDLEDNLELLNSENGFYPVPWCPFCGIVLQRPQTDLLQRDLFLTPSPV